MTTLADLYKQELKNNPISSRDVIALQAYMDGVFRLIIFIYSLSMAVLAFTYKFPFIFTILFLVIVFCLSYAFFTIATIGGILITLEGYHPFNLAFYIIESILLTLLFLGILYYFVNPFKLKKDDLKKSLAKSRLQPS